MDNLIATLSVVLLVLVAFDILKLWMIVYPLASVAPRFKLGDWSGG